ncbi:MAG: hypothetical protein M1826_001400 [Phylliscum demangeonii]|nr:MAG: hypothetical protein M1826_001400 [Phylliscum demangeonii]
MLSPGYPYVIQHPTLAEYITLCRRKVTPIYPAVANLIVSLLDIHVAPFSPTASGHGPRLEILEAGTGHGGLTLHLARAIQAANGCPPAEDSGAESRDGRLSPSDAADTTALTAWKATRRAIIHSVDLSDEYSRHAQQVVRDFRHGLYSPHIDFYSGMAVSDWVRQQLLRRSSTSPADSSPPSTPHFLTHIILDLPSSHEELELATRALLPTGRLLVFNPNINQIASCVEAIERQRLPLLPEHVLELGANSGTSGREWDVRRFQPRASAQADLDRALARVPAGARLRAALTGRPIVEAVAGEDEGEDEEGGVNGSGSIGGSKDSAEVEPDSVAEWHTICKPKPSAQVTVGGFLGVWTKKDEVELAQ